MIRGQRVFTPMATGAFAPHRRPVTMVSAAPMGVQRRHMADKIVIGGASAFMTCSTTLILFHLLVSPISAAIAAATSATAVATGALCIIDGGEGPGTNFGAIAGVLIGVMGGYYAKTQKEPWRK